MEIWLQGIQNLLYPNPNNLLTNWAIDFDLLSFLQKSLFVYFPFIQTLRSYFHLIFDNFPPRMSLVFTTVKKLEILKRTCTFLLSLTKLPLYSNLYETPTIVKWGSAFRFLQSFLTIFPIRYIRWAYLCKWSYLVSVLLKTK